MGRNLGTENLRGQVVSFDDAQERHQAWSESSRQVNAFLTAAAEWLTGQLDAIEGETWHAMSARLPAYGSLVGAAVQDVRDTARLAAELFIECLRDRRHLNDEERGRIAAIGRQRASLGVPVRDLREAVSIAVDVGGHHVLQFLQSDRSRVAIVEGSAALFTALCRFVSDFADALTGGHLSYGRHADDDQEDHAAMFVEALLKGSFSGDTEAFVTGNGFVEAKGWWWVVLLAPRSIENAALLHEFTSRCERALDAAGPGYVRREPLNHSVLLVPPRRVSPSKIATIVTGMAGDGDLVAVIEGMPDAAQVAPTYKFLRTLLPALDVIRPPAGILEAGELMAHALAPPRASTAFDVEYVRRALDPIPTMPPDETQEVLEALREVVVHGNSPDEVAARLGVHRSTVYRRLNTFEKLTGRSLKRPTDVRLITAAINILDRRASAPVGKREARGPHRARGG